MSLSAHQYSLSRGSKSECDLRPILASMDNLTIRQHDTSTGTASTTAPAQPKSQCSCSSCNKGLHGASYSLKEGMGVCCRRCHKESGVVRRIYCPECVDERQDFCGTCERFYCQHCFRQVDLKDNCGRQYCSRKCAKARQKASKQSNKNSQVSVKVKDKDTSTTQLPHSQSCPNLQHITQPKSTTKPAQSNPTRKSQTKQSTAKQPQQKEKIKYNCAWCTKGLTGKSTGPKQDQHARLGYYCKCSPQVYCNSCAVNHGDFCQGSCQAFVCRNCCPYDGWFTADFPPDIYCCKACTPADWKSSVFRRSLFDQDWEAEEHFRPLSRRCQGVDAKTGQACKVTASHPCAAAQSLKQGDDFCLNHGGYRGAAVSDIEEDDNAYYYDDDDDSDDTDYYFRHDG